MKLTDLAQAASADILQAPVQPIEIHGLSCDSRQVKPGDLFAALPGVKSDGGIFAKQAAERGAAAILTSSREPLTGLPQLVCADARLGLSNAARAYFGFADKKMKIGAVTGTNGKTTTAYLVRHLLRSAGKRCGMLGTIEYDLGLQSMEAPLTTPESLDMHCYLRQMAEAGCGHAFMETSSHALCQSRVAGIDFATAVFTNLTQDHLDYHRTMEEYREAKSVLFRNLSKNATAILNAGDEAAAFYAKVTPAKVLTFSTKGNAELRGQIVQMDIHGTRFKIESPWGAREVVWNLVGAHNVENGLGALAAAVSMGLRFDCAIAGLMTFTGVPGRLESVGDGASNMPFRVLVDYAHTDDALRSVMRALRELKPTRLITVFGCGGDRDRTKRPKMARAVEEMADLGVITSDNPRTENPDAIIGDIWGGVKKEQKFIVEPDRARAIDMAIREARAGDVVLIAGKGHENYQIVGKEKRHFSDTEQSLAAIRKRQGVVAHAYAAAGN